MLLRVRELRQEPDGHYVAATLNKGDVPVTDDDAETIRIVLERSEAELAPLIATLDHPFPIPAAIPVEIKDPPAA
jgi:hypothetical protein